MPASIAGKADVTGTGAGVACGGLLAAVGMSLVSSFADLPAVTLADVGRVELGAASYLFSSELNGKPMAGLAVQLTPGANALATALAEGQASRGVLVCGTGIGISIALAQLHVTLGHITGDRRNDGHALQVEPGLTQLRGSGLHLRSLGESARGPRLLLHAMGGLAQHHEALLDEAEVEPLPGEFHEGLAAGFVIHREREHLQLAGMRFRQRRQFVGRGRAPAGGDHARAARQQLARELEAQAAAGAGDDNAL